MVFNKKRRNGAKSTRDMLLNGSNHTSKDAVSSTNSSLNGTDVVAPAALRGILKQSDNQSHAGARIASRGKHRYRSSEGSESSKGTAAERSQGSRLSVSLHIDGSAPNSLDGSNVSSQHSETSIPQTKNVALHEQNAKEVRFEDVKVREFERVVGDNPSCSSGPPIGYVPIVTDCCQFLVLVHCPLSVLVAYSYLPALSFNNLLRSGSGGGIPIHVIPSWIFLRHRRGICHEESGWC